MSSNDRLDNARAQLAKNKREWLDAQSRAQGERDLNDHATEMLLDENLRLKQAHQIVKDLEVLVEGAKKRLDDSTAFLEKLDEMVKQAKAALHISEHEMIDASPNMDVLKKLGSSSNW
jgi:hypothetical protein